MGGPERAPQAPRWWPPRPVGSEACVIDSGAVRGLPRRPAARPRRRLGRGDPGRRELGRRGADRLARRALRRLRAGRRGRRRRVRRLHRDRSQVVSRSPRLRRRRDGRRLRRRHRGLGGSHPADERAQRLSGGLRRLGHPAGRLRSRRRAIHPTTCGGLDARNRAGAGDRVDAVEGELLGSWIPILWAAVVCDLTAACLALFCLKPLVASAMRRERASEIPGAAEASVPV